jgi:hypothetical protein
MYTACLIADALLDPKQTLNPEQTTINAMLIIGLLKDSTDPQDRERLQRLGKLLADYASECVSCATRGAA